MSFDILSKYKKELMGIAALMIVVFHYHELLTDANANVSFLVMRLLHSLNAGLDIFLILSGIGLYFSFRKKPRFMDYYRKRIVNVYFIFLVINLPFAILYSFVFEHHTVLHFAANWTSVAYFIPSLYTKRPGWYVTFIMVMYLLFPLIYKLYRFLERKNADAVFTALFYGVWVAVCYAIRTVDKELFDVVEIGLTRVPLMFIGCYFGKLVYNKEKITLPFYLLIAFGIIQKPFVMRFNFDLTVTRFSQNFFGISLCFLFAFILEKLNSAGINKILAFFGGISLELYLIHNMLKCIAMDWHYNSIFVYLGIIAVSVLLAYVASKLRMKALQHYQQKLIQRKST